MKEEELLEALETQASRVGALPVLSLLLDRVCQGMYLEIFADLCDLVSALTDGTPDMPRQIPAKTVTRPADFGGVAVHGGA